MMASPSELDPLASLIMDAFKRVIDREIAEANEVREEIKRRGTYWAGDEIWKLRRQVASLRKQLDEERAGQPRW